jgi:CheY-like chemotaxis protein
MGEGRNVIMDLTLPDKEFYCTANPGITATRTILIVDDSPVSVTLAELALSMIDRDIRTQSVSTGEKALEMLRTAQQLPAMILLDLEMPGMGGFETLRRIRADERLKAIPVVIVTSSTREIAGEEAREAGATGFVHKAIRLHEFSRDLEHHIKKLAKKRAS